jgi:hypothetical protein
VGREKTVANAFFVIITANSVLTALMGLRPAKLHENKSELSTIGRYRSGEVGQTVEKSRLFNCLIRSVRD